MDVARRYGACALVMVGAVVPVVPLLAHHSFFSEFDRTQPFTVVGVVRRVEWRNPHISLVVDETKKGKVVTWTFSGAAASVLERQGLTPTTVMVGDTVQVDGYRAIDGSSSGAAGRVRLPSKKRIFVGPLEDPVAF